MSEAVRELTELLGSRKPIRHGLAMAIMLLEASPEVAAEVMKAARPDQIREIMLATAELGQVPEELREAVRERFLEEMIGLRLEPVHRLVQAVRDQPSECASRLAGWVARSVRGAFHAAIVVMALPAADAAQMLRALEREDLHVIAVELVSLPPMEAAIRDVILERFLDELGLAGSNPGPEVETLVQLRSWLQDPGSVAACGLPRLQNCAVYIWLGRGLDSLVNRLVERIGFVRQQILRELGLVLPAIRVLESLQRAPRTYAIEVEGTSRGSGSVRADKRLAIGPEEKLNQLRGEKAVDPSYGMPGRWVDSAQARAAERMGCMVFDSISVIATHLSEVARSHAAELLGLEDAHALLQQHPLLLDQVLQRDLGLPEIWRVLQLLLEERVSIANLATILQTLALRARECQEPLRLAEWVREALGRSICGELVDPKGALNVLTLDAAVEEALQGAPGVDALGLDERSEAIMKGVAEAVKEMQDKGLQPIVLTRPALRPCLRQLTGPLLPNLVVLSAGEVPLELEVCQVGRVRLR